MTTDIQGTFPGWLEKNVMEEEGYSLQMNEWAMRKMCRWPLESGKGKEADSSLEFTGGTQVCQYFNLNSVKPIHTSALQNCKTINLYSLKH